jgi:hypothetical protein
MRGRTTKAPTIQPLTPAEKSRSDIARKKAGLWLHYTRGDAQWHNPEMPRSSMLSAFGLADPDRLQEAMAEYDELTIRRWMQDQESMQDESPHVHTEAHTRIGLPPVGGSWDDL